MENLSAADVAAVTHGNMGYGYGDGFGFGGGSGIWLFAILALMWGGNGFFGGRNAYANERCATVEDINNSANFTRLESQVQGIGQTMSRSFTDLGYGISSLGYEMAQQFGNTNTQMTECCCGINRNIDAVRYENALNTASINANTTAGIQRVLDKLCEDKASAQAARISQLELQQALCGVVRYPTNAAYAIGTPFNIGYGCCGNTNI